MSDNEEYGKPGCDCAYCQRASEEANDGIFYVEVETGAEETAYFLNYYIKHGREFREANDFCDNIVCGMTVGDIDRLFDDWLDFLKDGKLYGNGIIPDEHHAFVQFLPDRNITRDVVRRMVTEIEEQAVEDLIEDIECYYEGGQPLDEYIAERLDGWMEEPERGIFDRVKAEAEDSVAEKLAGEIKSDYDGEQPLAEFIDARLDGYQDRGIVDRVKAETGERIDEPRLRAKYAFFAVEDVADLRAAIVQFESEVPAAAQNDGWNPWSLAWGRIFTAAAIDWEDLAVRCDLVYEELVAVDDACVLTADAELTADESGRLRIYNIARREAAVLSKRAAALGVAPADLQAAVERFGERAPVARRLAAHLAQFPKTLADAAQLELVIDQILDDPGLHLDEPESDQLELAFFELAADLSLSADRRLEATAADYAANGWERAMTAGRAIVDALAAAEYAAFSKSW